MLAFIFGKSMDKLLSTLIRGALSCSSVGVKKVVGLIRSCKQRNIKERVLRIEFTTPLVRSSAANVLIDETNCSPT